VFVITDPVVVVISEFVSVERITRISDLRDEYVGYSIADRCFGNVMHEECHRPSRKIGNAGTDVQSFDAICKLKRNVIHRRWLAWTRVYSIEELSNTNLCVAVDGSSESFNGKSPEVLCAECLSIRIELCVICAC